MGANKHEAPPAADPDRGKSPGYPETEPRDKDDARQPDPRKPPNPDEGGTRREADPDPDPADE